MLRGNTYQASALRVELIEGRTRDELIEEFTPKVRLIANMISSKISHQVEFDDLMNAGVVGLLDAIDKFDPSRNNKFTTYAEFRIRGAILDSLRGLDLLTRSAREKANQLKKTLKGLQRQLGREPEALEVAEALKLSLEEYYELLEEVKGVTLWSLDAPSETDGEKNRSLAETLSDQNAQDAWDLLHNRDLRNVLAEAIKAMPERLKQIIMLYYYKELNLKEIGRVLDLSESRISQLHAEALLRLRNKIDKATGEHV